MSVNNPAGGGGGGPASIDDSDKAIVILVTNLAFILIVWLSLHFGFTPKLQKLARPEVPFGFKFIATATAVVAFFLSDPGTALVRGLIRPFRRGKPSRTDESIAQKARPIGLYIITVSSFLAIGSLVQATGGILGSVFASFAVTLVVAAPYLMTEDYTPYLNLAVAVLYLVGLLAISPARGDSSGLYVKFTVEWGVDAAVVLVPVVLTLVLFSLRVSFKEAWAKFRTNWGF